MSFFFSFSQKFSQNNFINTFESLFLGAKELIV